MGSLWDCYNGYLAGRSHSLFILILKSTCIKQSTILTLVPSINVYKQWIIRFSHLLPPLRRRPQFRRRRFAGSAAGNCRSDDPIIRGKLSSARAPRIRYAAPS